MAKVRRNGSPVPTMTPCSSYSAMSGTSRAGCCATPTTSTPTNSSNSSKLGLLPAPGRPRGHVTTFAKTLVGRHGERLADWIGAVHADDLADLHSFAAGLTLDVE